ncbi:MAG: tetratricopeptide repeat protein [Bdellovibrionales bacterium]|nr:tetratricopeptide repeat protein [Bdellovibrionales bacterium]
MTSFPKISLCMIAKNEEEYLEQALRSVQPIVDEIVLVDTGSTDRTMDIASSFGAKIIEDPWRDDFAASRNVSIAHATGDWILVLDADEAIDARQHALVKQLILRENACYLFTQRHYTNDQRLSAFQPCRGEYPHWERHYVGYFESSLCRLFPRDSRIEYRGVVHELVEHSIGEHSDLVLLQTPVRLHHFGHTPESLARKNKSALYTPLGEKKVHDEPTTWKGFFELGVELNCNGKRAESAVAFEKAAELNPEYINTWVNYGYVLIELERYVEAERALSKALELDSNNPEAFCNLGVLYMRQLRWANAVPCFENAIARKPDYLNAYSNLGTCYMKLGKVHLASRAFQRGYELAPNNGQLLVRFGFALLEVGILDDAKRILQRAVQLSPKDPAAWYSLGKTLEGLQLPKEAELAFEKVRQLT